MMFWEMKRLVLNKIKGYKNENLAFELGDNKFYVW